MANSGESSSVPPNSTNEKPVIIRVKRKACQSRVEALWLEINERPAKRPLLDFGKLSISDSSGNELLKTKKVLARHVETVSSSEAIFNCLQSISSDCSLAFEKKCKITQRKTLKNDHKSDERLAKARQDQEVLAKNARFEQIWRSRKGNKEPVIDQELHEACRLYDIVRVDAEETSNETHIKEETSMEDYELMQGYMSLLREFLPNAAEEVEAEMYECVSGKAKEKYVYDLYTVYKDVEITEEDASHPFPLVQLVEDDYFYDGPAESEYESDDSNAEDNPRNEYPDEEEEDDDDDDDDEEEDSDDELGEAESDESFCSDDSSGHSDILFEDKLYDLDDVIYGVDDCDDDHDDMNEG